MKKILFTLFALIFIIACSKTDEQKVENADQQNVTTENSSQPIVNHRYGIKSGVIFYTAPMGTKQELYFDDYGAKEVFTTSIDLGIEKSKTIEIRKVVEYAKKSVCNLFFLKLSMKVSHIILVFR